MCIYLYICICVCVYSLYSNQKFHYSKMCTHTRVHTHSPDSVDPDGFATGHTLLCSFYSRNARVPVPTDTHISPLLCFASPNTEMPFFLRLSLCPARFIQCLGGPNRRSGSRHRPYFFLCQK